MDRFQLTIRYGLRGNFIASECGTIPTLSPGLAGSIWQPGKLVILKIFAKVNDRNCKYLVLGWS